MSKSAKTPKTTRKSKLTFLGSSAKKIMSSSAAKKRLSAKSPLGAGTTSAVKFGSVGENALIYLKEGVEAQVSELQLAIAERELAKKNALEVLSTMTDLQSDCSMSDIRQRLNTVVSALIEIYDVI